MTHRLSILLVMLSSLVAGTRFVDAGTYCRFEINGTTAYGEVREGRVHALASAPWQSLELTGAIHDLDQVRLLAPSEPRLIVGLVKAYRNAWPAGDEPPAVRWFFKPPGAAATPDAPLVLPDFIDEVKAEVELVIVIGKMTKNASPEEAAASIFGYTIGNDLVGQVASFKLLTGDTGDRDETMLGAGLKGADGFAPFGPFIHAEVDWRDRERVIEVLSEEPDRAVTDVSNTSDLVYEPAQIVSDLSKVMTLQPGDIIFSGTNKALPARAGDRISLSIEGIGALTTILQ